MRDTGTGERRGRRRARDERDRRERGGTWKWGEHGDTGTGS